MMQELDNLYRALKENRLTEAGHQRFLELMAADKNEAQAKAIIEAIAIEAETAHGPGLSEEDLKAICDSIYLAGASAVVKPLIQSKVKKLFQQSMVAASILLLVGIAAFYFFNSPQQLKKANAIQQADIQPGRDGALLTLANGSTLLLDSIKNGVVALEGGVTASIENGQLKYAGTGTSVVYNTMSTPKGRQFRLQLPDGTKVWLNAASSIRYPSAFTGGERRVELKGEGYFEVTPDKQKPFYVDLDKQQSVQVLGTSFNITAYDDEPCTSVSLLNGSVKVNNPAASLVLKAGEQAAVRENILLVNGADVNEAAAWINGSFNFDGVSTEAFVRQLGRWYDVNIVFEGKVPERKFRGSLGRDLVLSEVIETLKAFNINSRLEENTLYISNH